MINLHKCMGLGRDRTCDPWICSHALLTGLWGRSSIISINSLQEEHSGVLDLRLSGRWFEPHGRYCVVSLSKTLDPLLITSST